MAPVEQYVFAEMLGISEHFAAGSHEWLPYSVIPAFLEQIGKQQFRLSALVSKTQDIGKRPKYWTPKDVYWHQKEGVGNVQKESSELQPVYRTFFH